MTGLLLDINVYTDRVIHARCFDVIVVDKDKNECLVIDNAVLGDRRVEMKADEKIKKYQDLCRELRKL